MKVPFGALPVNALSYTSLHIVHGSIKAKAKLAAKLRKRESFTNILWLSVKGAILCFNLML